MKDLATEFAELKRCGETLISISETLARIFSEAEKEARSYGKASDDHSGDS